MEIRVISLAKTCSRKMKNFSISLKKSEVSFTPLVVTNTLENSFLISSIINSPKNTEVFLEYGNEFENVIPIGVFDNNDLITYTIEI